MYTCILYIYIFQPQKSISRRFATFLSEKGDAVQWIAHLEFYHLRFYMLGLRFFVVLCFSDSPHLKFCGYEVVRIYWEYLLVRAENIHVLSAPQGFPGLQQIFRPTLWCLNGSMGICHCQVWEKQLGIVHKQLRVIWVFPMQPLLNGYWSLGWCTHHISPALFKVGTHFLFHHGFLNPGSNSWTFHPNFPFNMSISHGNILCFAAADSMGSSVFTGHYWNGLWKWGANLPHFQVHTQLSYCWFMLVQN